MTAAWMAYGIAISLALGVAGLATDRALYLTGRPTRWAWSATLLGTLLLPLGAILRPEAFASITVPLAALVPQAANGPTAVSWRGLIWTDLDRVLLWGWGLSSVALLAVLGLAAARLAALRRSWRPALVEGRLVLVADHIGPAVAGLWPPRIVIPGWALGLTANQQRLMLAHEEEHVRARDPWLLALGTAAPVLIPWNPVAWWLLRQLRLAVEMDCDARVLGRGHSAPAYGELLLQVGQRRAHLLLTAAALGEPQSFLARRIRRMVARRPRWRWLVATCASAIAAAAVVAACEAPRPTASEVPHAAVDGGVVDGLVMRLSAPPRQYPTLLRLAGIQGRVLVRAIIDSTGRAEPASVNVNESPHPGFDQAARAVLLEARFPHGRSRHRAVRALIEFRLDGRAGA
jgi:TonB family protein